MSLRGFREVNEFKYRTSLAESGATWPWAKPECLPAQIMEL